nr:MAG TPA: hypothetical protein [Caudoviricetes sp.]
MYAGITFVLDVKKRVKILASVSPNRKQQFGKFPVANFIPGKVRFYITHNC